ncbi:hypothetical protein DL95DRAFT_418463, partial [Leptodontidium sp. 2 PMI_412]
MQGGSHSDYRVNFVFMPFASTLPSILLSYFLQKKALKSSHYQYCDGATRVVLLLGYIRETKLQEEGELERGSSFMTRRGRMERVVEDSTLTRQSRRERTKTPKALELEKRRHGGKSVNGNLFGTLSQRPSAAKDWDESNESDTDDVIEVRDGTPDAPRPNRTRHRPKNLSNASTGESTRTEEAEGGLLSTILSAIEE